MEKLINRAVDLLKVKTVITFAVVTVFSVLAIQGRIDSSDVMLVVSMVVSFYFGTQHEKTANK